MTRLSGPAGLLRVMLAACVLAFALVPLVATCQGIPGPTARYSAERDGVTMDLDYFAAPAGPALLFGIGRPGETLTSLPPLEEQGSVLEGLLGRFADAHPDLPDTLQIMLGAPRQSLIEVLDRRLVQPDADWDGKRGRPRRGQFGEVLKAALADVIRSSPIAAAFAEHGYSLRLTGLGRIDIEKADIGGGARVPVAIDNMFIQADKAPKKD